MRIRSLADAGLIEHEEFVRVAVKAPDEPVAIRTVRNHHSVFHDLVGGYFDLAFLPGDLIVFVNDVGALMPLPYNFSTMTRGGFMTDLYGTAVIARQFIDETVSLRDEDVAMIEAVFQ